MTTKPVRKDHLRGHLARSREITITVTGRKSGRAIANPVWFVLDGDNLYLVPVTGADTQWYKNVLQNPSIQIDADGAKAEVKIVPISDPKQVSSAVDKFRKKYGPADIKKYYSKLDVALSAQLP